MSTHFYPTTVHQRRSLSLTLSAEISSSSGSSTRMAAALLSSTMSTWGEKGGSVVKAYYTNMIQTHTQGSCHDFIRAIPRIFAAKNEPFRTKVRTHLEALVLAPEKCVLELIFAHDLEGKVLGAGGHRHPQVVQHLRDEEKRRGSEDTRVQK